MKIWVDENAFISSGGLGYFQVTNSEANYLELLQVITVEALLDLSMSSFAWPGA